MFSFKRTESVHSYFYIFLLGTEHVLVPAEAASEDHIVSATIQRTSMAVITVAGTESSTSRVTHMNVHRERPTLELNSVPNSTMIP